MSEQTPNVKRFIIPLLMAGMIITAIVGSISSAGQPQSPNPCLAANSVCLQPIRYDGFATGNVTCIDCVGTPSTTVVTSPFTINQNETMIVVASTGICNFTPACIPQDHENVTSLTDALNNPFTLQVYQQFMVPAADSYALEIFSARNTIPGPVVDQITAVWNASDSHVIQVFKYLGVAGIGAKASIATSSGGVTSVSLGTTRAGSWLFTVGLALPGLYICGIITQTLAGWLTRNDFCNLNASLLFDGSETLVQDNATALRNGLVLQSTFSFPSSTNGQGAAAMIELQSSDLEPNQFTGVKSIAKNSFANNIENAVLNTAYCTGWTLTGFTTTNSSSTLLVTGIYAVQDQNVTGGPVMQVSFALTTTAPPTAYGTGCSALSPGITKIYFATFGSALTAHGVNEYYATASYVKTGLPPATYYLFIGIVSQSASLKIAQWGADTSLSMTLLQG